MASSASTKETLSSSGTRKSRSLATRVSNTATTAASSASFAAVDQRGQEQAARARARGHAPRHEEVGEQGEEDQQLERGRPLDQGQVAARVLEHHGLVDHGQLEVRGRVVHRQPPRLGQRHDEERGEGEEIARAHRLRGALHGARHDLAQVGGARARARARTSPSRWWARRARPPSSPGSSPCRRTASPGRARRGPGRTSRAAAGRRPPGDRRPRRAAAAPPGWAGARVTASVLVKTTYGARRKSHEAFVETTTSLAKSFRSSRYGCHTGAPRRFCMRAFSHRISPMSPGARARQSAACPSASA